MMCGGRGEGRGGEGKGGGEGRGGEGRRGIMRGCCVDVQRSVYSDGSLDIVDKLASATLYPTFM